MYLELAEESSGGEDKGDAAEAVVTISSSKGMWWRQQGLDAKAPGRWSEGGMSALPGNWAFLKVGSSLRYFSGNQTETVSS